jgi:hypothetical protein
MGFAGISFPVSGAVMGAIDQAEQSQVLSTMHLSSARNLPVWMARFLAP